MARPRNAREFFEVFRPPGSSKSKGLPPQQTGGDAMGASEATEKPEEAKAPAESQVSQDTAQETKKRVEPVGDALAPAESLPPETSAPASAPKALEFGSGRVTVHLSNEAFAAAVVVAVLVLVAAFAVGNFWGRRKAPTIQVAVPEPAKAAPAATTSKKVRDTGIVRREVIPLGVTGAKEPRAVAPAPAKAPVKAPAPVVATPGPPQPTGSYWTIQVVAGINPNKAAELRVALERQGLPNVVVKLEGRYATVRVGRFESKDSPEALQFKKLISDMKYENKLQFKECYLVKVE